MATLLKSQIYLFRTYSRDTPLLFSIEISKEALQLQRIERIGLHIIYLFIIYPFTELCSLKKKMSYLVPNESKYYWFCQIAEGTGLFFATVILWCEKLTSGHLPKQGRIFSILWAFFPNCYWRSDQTAVVCTLKPFRNNNLNTIEMILVLLKGYINLTLVINSRCNTTV